MANTFVLSDESINDRGYRILTGGIDTSRFEANPVMLWMHRRDDGFGMNQVLPIGRWENIRKEDGRLMADPVFDDNDNFAQLVKTKVDNGFVRGASIGVKINELSNDEKHLLAGQTRSSVTACEIYEASIVDVPANKNTVRLFSSETESDEIPLLKLITDMSEETNVQPVTDTLTADKPGLIAWLKETFGFTPIQHEPVKSDELVAAEKLAADKQLEIEALGGQIIELSAQIEALKNAPGATVTDTTEATDDAPVTNESAMLDAEFNRVLKLIKK